MNQRITKLVRQALNECVSTPVESVIASRIDDHGIVEIPNTFAEKFAELLIRECIDIAGKEDFDVMMKEGYPCSQTAKKIKEHFGVGE